MEKAQAPEPEDFKEHVKARAEQLGFNAPSLESAVKEQLKQLAGREIAKKILEGDVKSPPHETGGVGRLR